MSMPRDFWTHASLSPRCWVGSLGLATEMSVIAPVGSVARVSGETFLPRRFLQGPSSERTLGFDMRTKAGLYARAGIVEYWVLDIPGRRLIVHRDPQGGRYASVVAYGARESVAPLAAPESRFRVSDAFLEERLPAK